MDYVTVLLGSKKSGLLKYLNKLFFFQDIPRLELNCGGVLISASLLGLPCLLGLSVSVSVSFTALGECVCACVCAQGLYGTCSVVCEDTSASFCTCLLWSSLWRSLILWLSISLALSLPLSLLSLGLCSLLSCSHFMGLCVYSLSL